jgi:hypothetical protein
MGGIRGTGGLFGDKCDCPAFLPLIAKIVAQKRACPPYLGVPIRWIAQAASCA